MKDIITEINRIISALNTPALAFNEVAAENSFPLIPVIELLDREKPELPEGTEKDSILADLYIWAKAAAAMASVYQQALAKQPRDREVINATKQGYEEARDDLVLRMEKINS